MGVFDILKNSNLSSRLNRNNVTNPTILLEQQSLNIIKTAESLYKESKTQINNIKSILFLDLECLGGFIWKYLQHQFYDTIRSDMFFNKLINKDGIFLKPIEFIGSPVEYIEIKKNICHYYDFSNFVAFIYKHCSIYDKSILPYVVYKVIRIIIAKYFNEELSMQSIKNYQDYCIKTKEPLSNYNIMKLAYSAMYNNKGANSLIDHFKAIKAKVELAFSEQKAKDLENFKKTKSLIKDKQNLIIDFAKEFYKPTVNLIKLNEKFRCVISEPQKLLKFIKDICIKYRISFNSHINCYLYSLIKHDFIGIDVDLTVMDKDINEEEHMWDMYQKYMQLLEITQRGIYGKKDLILSEYLETIYQKYAEELKEKDAVYSAVYLSIRYNLIKYFAEKYINEFNTNTLYEYVKLCKSKSMIRCLSDLDILVVDSQIIMMYICHNMTATDNLTKSLFKDYDEVDEKIKRTLIAIDEKIANDILFEEYDNSVINMDELSGYEFESLLAKLFSKMGYKTEITKGSGDFGIDVIADNGITRIGIQAKCYVGHKVGNDAVQQAISGKEYYGLDKAMVITNSYFTQSAIQQAKGSKVTLWNRDNLLEKLNIFN